MTMTTTSRSLLQLLADLAPHSITPVSLNLMTRPIDVQREMWETLRAEYDTTPTLITSMVYLNFEVDGLPVRLTFDANAVGSAREVTRTEYVIDGIGE